MFQLDLCHAHLILLPKTKKNVAGKLFFQNECRFAQNTLLSGCLKWTLLLSFKSLPLPLFDFHIDLLEYEQFPSFLSNFYDNFKETNTKNCGKCPAVF